MKNYSNTLKLFTGEVIIAFPNVVGKQLEGCTWRRIYMLINRGRKVRGACELRMIEAVMSSIMVLIK